MPSLITRQERLVTTRSTVVNIQSHIFVEPVKGKPGVSAPLKTRVDDARNPPNHCSAAITEYLTAQQVSKLKRCCLVYLLCNFDDLVF